MAASRLQEDSAGSLPVRAYCDQLRAKGSVDGLLSRIAFFAQPVPISFAMMERLVGSDPTFGATLAQSVMGVAARKEGEAPANLAEALDALGAAGARLAVLATAQRIWLRSACPHTNLPTSDIVRQCVFMGLAARRMGDAQATPAGCESLGVACAHAVGIGVLSGCFGPAYGEFWWDAICSGMPLHEAESLKFDVAHGEAADWLVEAFDLHRTLGESFRKHHEPLSRLQGHALRTAVAECLSVQCGFGAGLARAAYELPTSWAIRLGIRAADLPELVQEAERWCGYLQLDSKAHS